MQLHAVMLSSHPSQQKLEKSGEAKYTKVVDRTGGASAPAARDGTEPLIQHPNADTPATVARTSKVETQVDNYRPTS